jgi:hypothetical protein
VPLQHRSSNVINAQDVAAHVGNGVADERLEHREVVSTGVKVHFEQRNRCKPFDGGCRRGYRFVISCGLG